MSFIMRLMQRLLYLHLRDHLLPLCLALPSIYPQLPIVGNESTALNGCVDLNVPLTICAISTAQPLIPLREELDSGLKCQHGQMHTITLVKSHSQFKGSSFDD